MKAPHFLLFLTFLGCQVEPLENWTPNEAYINVEVVFLNNDYPHLEDRVLEAADLLEVGINSENFRHFVMRGDFNEDNKESYERYTGQDIVLVVAPKGASPNLHGFSVNKTTNIISVYDHYSLERMSLHQFTAILAHEYGHTIGFDHNGKDGPSVTSFSFYLQFAGENFFKYIHENVSHYPREGEWLFLY